LDIIEKSLKKEIRKRPWEKFEIWKDFWNCFNKEILLKFQDWLFYGIKNLLPLIQIQQAAIEEFLSQGDNSNPKKLAISYQGNFPKYYNIKKHVLEEIFEEINCILKNPFQKDLNLDLNEIKIEINSIQNNDHVDKKHIKVIGDPLSTIEKNYEKKQYFDKKPETNESLSHHSILINQIENNKNLIYNSIKEDSMEKNNKLLNKKILKKNDSNDLIQEQHKKKTKLESNNEINKQIKIETIEEKVQLDEEKDREIEFLLNSWKSDYSTNKISTDFENPFYNSKYAIVDDYYDFPLSPINHSNFIKNNIIEKQVITNSFSDSEVNNYSGEKNIDILHRDIIDPESLNFVQILDIFIENNKTKEKEFKKYKKEYLSKFEFKETCKCKYNLVKKFLDLIGIEANIINLFVTFGYPSFRNWLKKFKEEDKDFLICLDENCENRKLRILCTNFTCGVFSLCANKYDKTLKNKIKYNLFLSSKENQQIGLFTKNFIRKGEFVIEYLGELKYMNEVIKLDFDKKDKSKIRKINDKFYLDANEKGNFSRFVNTSDNPNCEYYNYFRKIGINKNEFFILLSAKRDIEINEEITVEDSLFKNI